MSKDLIDTIYEAAFVPELWPDALEQMAALSNSMGTAIFLFADGKPTIGRARESQRQQMDEFLASDPLQTSLSVQRVCHVQPTSFVDVDTLMSQEEIEGDLVRSHYRSMGIGAHVSTAIPMPSGELVIFTQQRWLADGPYSRWEIDALDGLRPHLSRASLVAARLGLERAQNTVTAMEAMGLPAAVLTASGRVQATNTLFEDMSSVFLPVALGGVAIGEPDANRLFQQVILSARSGEEPLVRSIPLSPRNNRPPLIVHILPLRRTAHEIFSGGDLLVVATAVSTSALVPSPSILTGLFDLTPAEAKLATALSAGTSLKHTAASQGIRVNTARQYLAQVFHKTGTHQQSELVALLKSAQPLQFQR